MDIQPAQAMPREHRVMLARGFAAVGNAFTIRAGERIVFCGGAVELHPGHAQLWAVFAIGKRSASHKIARATRQFIAQLPHTRVDVPVDDTPEARRWAELLGLTYDVTLADAALGGGDIHLYRRIT